MTHEADIDRVVTPEEREQFLKNAATARAQHANRNAPLRESQAEALRRIAEERDDEE